MCVLGGGGLNAAPDPHFHLKRDGVLERMVGLFGLCRLCCELVVNVTCHHAFYFFEYIHITYIVYTYHNVSCFFFKL